MNENETSASNPVESKTARSSSFEKTTLDEIGFGGLTLAQGKGFRYGVDAILLAAFAAGETGGTGIRQTRRNAITEALRICDIGCGNGIVSLVLSHKIPHSTIVGIEVRESEAMRAKENVKRNHLENRIRIVQSDVQNLNSSELANPEQKVDAVVMNPPYFRKGGAIPNEASDKYIARHETTATLDDFIRVASTMLQSSGDLFMVHRPDRLIDICTAMRNHNVEPKELQMVVPRPGEAANILLVHGIRGAGPELKVLPEIPVRNLAGDYTEIIQHIYERETSADATSETGA